MGIGGKRIGAGRKKNLQETKSITFHIQVEWELEIRKLIKDFKLEKKINGNNYFNMSINNDLE